MDSVLLIISVLLVSFIVIAFAIVYPVSQTKSQTRRDKPEIRWNKYHRHDLEGYVDDDID